MTAAAPPREGWDEISSVQYLTSPQEHRVVQAIALRKGDTWTALLIDGSVATFKLVRKRNGRIDHVDVKVDDKTATVSEMTYVYKEADGGGTIRFANQYDQIAGNFVLKSQTGKVDIPHYNADINSTFANYKLNVPVDDAVFRDSGCVDGSVEDVIARAA